MQTLIRMLFVAGLEFLNLETKAMPRDLLYPSGFAGFMCLQLLAQRLAGGSPGLLLPQFLERKNSWKEETLSDLWFPTLSWKGRVRLWEGNTVLSSISLTLTTSPGIQKVLESPQYLWEE